MYWRLREIVNPDNATIRDVLIRDWLHKLRDENLLRLAQRLPARLIYWSMIVGISHATVGKYGTTVVPDLAAMDALKRYGQDHNLYGRGPASD